MARIADYLVISDARHELHKSGQRPVREDFKFTLESGAHVSSRAILAFVLKVDNDAEDLHLTVEINGIEQVSYTFSGFRSSSTLHEVIDRDVLKADGENSIEFELDAGDGSGGVRFGDVVLLYQRDV